MSKKVLVISTSLRENSNSAALAEEFARGAADAGNDVELITLRNREIAFCKGCMACQKAGRCVIDDDANEITEKVASADVIAWATPVYYYEMSGQMKTTIDRMNALFNREYAFREVYALTVAAEEEDFVPARAVEGVRAWVDNFKEARFAGSLFCGGVVDPNDIAGNEKLAQAYEMGKNV